MDSANACGALGRRFKSGRARCHFHFEQTTPHIIQNFSLTMVITVQMVNKIKNELEQKPILSTTKSPKK